MCINCTLFAMKSILLNNQNNVRWKKARKKYVIDLLLHIENNNNANEMYVFFTRAYYVFALFFLSSLLPK